tara:strand:+ start:62 stop:568 length:507 start_codon:yes stop_codon:yes gene_type:complete
MSDFKKTQPGLIGGQAIDETSTEQLHPLGMRVFAEDLASTDYGVGEFIYLKGVASTALGSFITYTEDSFSTALLAANAVGQVAVSMSANVANQYGWYQISGKAVGKALTSYADNGLVYATSTAGSIDDEVVSGDRVKRAIGASAVGTPSSGLAEFDIQYPFMDDGAAS